MHVDMWYTVIQCTIVLRLSSKDTHPYPNTLPIRSLPEVNFWVFHPKDLSPFLIRLTRAFTFHHYSFFFFFCHFMHFSQFLFSFTQPWCKWNAMRLIILIHKYHKYKIKFLLIQILLKLQFIPKFHNFSTIPKFQ